MAAEPDSEAETLDVRARILDAAAGLLAAGGIAALTTRAVASAASVQAPTLYRLFGEKRGLLNTVAEHALAAFVARKAGAPPDSDPVRDLADAWDDYVAFGLANPAVFAIMNEVGAPAAASPAMQAGLAILRTRVERIARAGRLRIPVERGVALVHAAGVGTVTTLLAIPEAERDPELSPTARAATLAAITQPRTKESDEASMATSAIALRAHLTAALPLTPGERLLLTELLDRLSQPPARS